MRATCRRQKGVVLMVAMVMLLLLAMVALMTFGVGKGSLQVVGNLQQREQVLAAAQEAIEEAVSTTRLFSSPGSVLANPCNGVANTRCVDVNGDGTYDVTVTLAVTCVRSQLTVLKLPLSSDDVGCVKGVDADGNIQSACTDTLWNIRALATDSVTQASTTVSEGVSVRMLTPQAAVNCP